MGGAEDRGFASTLSGGGINWAELLCLRHFLQIGLPSQPQRHAILSGYIRRHHTEMGEQGVAKELMEDMPGEGDLE